MGSNRAGSHAIATWLEPRWQARTQPAGQVMNPEQELWWRQAESDHSVFVHLRRAGIPECHLLHYLQMATEKLSKAYLWRSGHAPPRTHVGFVRFLRAL